jgi:dipeptidyl aminopeptidase/acylaminoacyl peptidase
MKTFIIFAVAFVAFSVAAIGVSAQLPKLVDREIFFGNPEYAAAQISPDGKFISFIRPFKDTMNIWVKGIDEPFDAARPLTADTLRPIRSYFWSRDSKYILYSQDKGGDENFNVYAVSPNDEPADGADVPASRNLTDAKGIRAYIYAVPRSEPDAIYVGINERDKAWHDVYKVTISTGKRELVKENNDRYNGVVFDNADKLRIAVRSAQNGDTEFLRFNDDGTTTMIYTCGLFETCFPVAFNKDNKRLYIQTNKGDLDLIELELLDVATGKSAKVESDPLGKVDLGGVSISEITNEVIATNYEDSRNRTYWKDKKFKGYYDTIKKRLGDREINFQSSTKDEKKFIVVTSSDVDPGTVWLFDTKSKNLSTLYQVREKLDRSVLAPMTAISYPSSDGLEIPAYLTLPKGVPAKDLPLVVFPHGGPWGRDSWGYMSYAQFLANRGYAVLNMNFRGSTGYGKKFLNAGNNEWGEKMQDDITWGVKYLVGKGIADPKRVGIMGGSYGGYATLAGVAFTPDVYAAAVAIVAPSNLKTLLESVPPYWESVRTLFYKRMGDPNTPEGLAQMKRQSPLFSADKIKTPLMVVQGANDPRVNKRESDQIVIALRDRDYPVEYIVAPDEGHGFARPVNNMAMLAAAEKFLAKHLGGRYQESMTKEVETRLGEITVDPKTVKLAESKDDADVGASAADPMGSWLVSVNAGGQPVDVLIQLKATESGFGGTMLSELGGGAFEKGTIEGNKISGLIDADIQGQPMKINLTATIDGDSISGTLSVPGFGAFPFSGSRQK